MAFRARDKNLSHIPSGWSVEKFLSSANRGFANQEMGSSSTATPGKLPLSWQAGVFTGRDFRDSRADVCGKGRAFFRVREGNGAVSPLHATRVSHARRGRNFRGNHSRASERDTLRRRVSRGRASPVAGSRVGFGIWSSARGRDAPAHMSTNATAAIAGPQGGGKAGGGGNGVSDSASVARRCASTLGTRARRRITTPPTHVATGFFPHSLSDGIPFRSSPLRRLQSELMSLMVRIARARRFSRVVGENPRVSASPSRADRTFLAPPPPRAFSFRFSARLLNPLRSPFPPTRRRRRTRASAPSRTAITSSTGSGPSRAPRGRCVTPPTRSDTPASRPPPNPSFARKPRHREPTRSSRPINFLFLGWTQPLTHPPPDCSRRCTRGSRTS